jgi:hypothetical protein
MKIPKRVYVPIEDLEYLIENPGEYDAPTVGLSIEALRPYVALLGGERTEVAVYELKAVVTVDGEQK